MGTSAAAVERELHRIPGVTAARIVTDEAGRPTEVHVLAKPGKHARQVVRAVQSVAQASFDVALDHRAISVVQLEDGAAGLAVERDPEAAERIVVTGVTSTRSGFRCTAEVVLSRGEERAVGSAEGAGAATTFPRLVAEATLAALRQLKSGAGRADVESAALVRVGERTVATATIVLMVPPYEEVVAGSAIVWSAGEPDAVARAVLAATNRRLEALA